MIPPSVQKMIEEEADRYENSLHGVGWDADVVFGSKNGFELGAEFSYELGFSQGIEAVVDWMEHDGGSSGYIDIASFKNHFKDQLRKTE